jgi:hypothetical protein
MPDSESFLERGRSHPDIDGLLKDPTNNPLPGWHVPISAFYHRLDEPEIKVEVTHYHPNADEQYASFGGVSVTHPSIHSVLAAILPSTHPNCDDMLQFPEDNPMPLSFAHPQLSFFQTRLEKPDIQREVTFYHPPLDASYRKGVGVDVSKHPDLQEFFAPVLPETHPLIMPMLQDPAGHPLPGEWHPKLSDFQSVQPAPRITVKVTAYHPSVDVSYTNGDGVSVSHPDIHAKLAAVLPRTHPHVMEMLSDPEGNPLPDWHPLLSAFNTPQRKPPPVPTTYYHPDVDDAYAKDEGISEKHPSIQNKYARYIPSSHPDIDQVLADPAGNPLPDWHPLLSEFNRPGPEPIVAIPVTFYHPRVDLEYDNGVSISSNHPDLQHLFQNVLPERHPLISEMLADPQANPLPTWHPRLSSFQRRQPEVKLKKKVSYFHPNIDLDYKNGVNISNNHPDIHEYLAEVLPPTHPNVQQMLKEPTAHMLPGWHPRLSSFQKRLPKPTVHKLVSFYHPTIDTSYDLGVGIDLTTHPNVAETFKLVLPPTHPPVMDLLSNPAGHPLPNGDWHPSLSMFLHRKPEPNVQRGVSVYHPNVDISYASGVGLDLLSHPNLDGTFATVLPATHPDIHMLLANPKAHPLPTNFDHPPLSKFLKRSDVPDVKIDVTFYHPDIDRNYKRGVGVDTRKHPNVQTAFNHYLPETHPPIMVLLANPQDHQLPEWHPVLSNFQNRLQEVVQSREVSFYHPDVVSHVCVCTSRSAT